MPDELRAVRVPVSLDALYAEVERCQADVDLLLDSGRRLVEAVERLVCRLYDLPDALTELVVARAVARSGTMAMTDD
jgi:hypothetical protein